MYPTCVKRMTVTPRLDPICGSAAQNKAAFLHNPALWHCKLVLGVWQKMPRFFKVPAQAPPSVASRIFREAPLRRRGVVGKFAAVRGPAACSCAPAGSARSGGRCRRLGKGRSLARPRSGRGAPSSSMSIVLQFRAAISTPGFAFPAFRTEAVAAGSGDAAIKVGATNGKSKAGAERRKADAWPVDQARVLPPLVDNSVSDSRHLVRSQAGHARTGYSKC